MPGIETLPQNKAAATWWKANDKVRKALPADFVIRPLSAEDYDRGYLECLGQLTKVGPISREQFQNRLGYMLQHPESYMPIVIETQGRIVACGTLLIEYKFIHDCGKLGHIEDIVVASEQRGTGLGRLLIQQLTELAFAHGCYKITLDCDVKNETFYGKSSFVTKGLQMCIYHQEAEGGKSRDSSTTTTTVAATILPSPSVSTNCRNGATSAI